VFVFASLHISSLQCVFFVCLCLCLPVCMYRLQCLCADTVCCVSADIVRHADAKEGNSGTKKLGRPLFCAKGSLLTRLLPRPSHTLPYPLGFRVRVRVRVPVRVRVTLAAF
jgi:hypothetical protein